MLRRGKAMPEVRFVEYPVLRCGAANRMGLRILEANGEPKATLATLFIAGAEQWHRGFGGVRV